MPDLVAHVEEDALMPLHDRRTIDKSEIVGLSIDHLSNLVVRYRRTWSDGLVETVDGIIALERLHLVSTQEPPPPPPPTGWKLNFPEGYWGPELNPREGVVLEG